MTMPITEIMEDLNKDVKNLSKYDRYKNGLAVLFQHAYLKEKKFLLPDGQPPYKQSPEPIGMTPVNLLTEIRRMYIFCREDLKPFKREQMFIGLLEGLHEDEVKMMVAIKDQKLNKLYPKLTKKWAESVGFLPKTDSKA